MKILKKSSSPPISQESSINLPYTDLSLLPTLDILALLAQEHNLYISGHTDFVLCIVLTLDNKYILSSSKDSTICIWRLQKKTLKAVLVGHT